MNDGEGMDLRARYKQATREAIGSAALRLAIERGPHGLALVRVQEIAEAAGVSPRTYNNYFSSREEAICASQADRARRLGEVLRSRPADEPLGEAITAAVIDLFTDPEPDRAGLSMIMSTPALEGEALKAFAMAEEPLAEAIAERTGTDPATDLFPQVTAAAVAAAVRIAGRHWLTPGDPRPFGTVLRRALAHVIPAASDEPPPGGGR
ncbi:TetR/AcrR family transcriptional regulator [Sphaerisporangium fuscum]|uniref:TetR/AcrR family transcriptional regulator n=1 Tax=Sphaerisporangium fuscum TaxID=2835868 RepID=UPI001BDD4DDB|nr:TetR family transcriptional regulator [Sphaerisporangium fuscum]